MTKYGGTKKDWRTIGDRIFGPDQGKAHALAAAFLDVVWEWTTPEEFAEIKRRNAMPEYRDTGSCATHDFFDANTAMAEAFRRTFGRLPETNENEADNDVALWNAAWDIARTDLTESAACAS